MSLYEGSNKTSSQISIAQYTETTELMKYMNVEVGDIGQVLLPLNENENRRRYLNGQAILQQQFPKFTQKLKAAVSLYPQLACTEAEWQAYRQADPDDQCPKFVIDDVSGLIRLPRIKFLCGSLNLYKMSEGLPTNRRLIKSYRNGASWYNLYSDGWLEQGGRANTSNSDTAVNLHLPYADTNYSVCAGNNTNGTWDSRCACNVHSTTQIHLRSGQSVQWMWQTNGYAAIPKLSEQDKHTANEFESPYYIQVSTGVEYEVDVINTISHNSPYSFGMYTRSTGKLNNVSWLKSDGTYHSGTAYPDMYNWILQNYSGARNDEIEVGVLNQSYQWHNSENPSHLCWTTKRTVKVGDPAYGYAFNSNKTSDIAGFITSVIDENTYVYFNVRTQTNMTMVYEDIVENNRGITDYQYVIDFANQTFRLPLLVGDEMVPEYNNNNGSTFDIQYFPDYLRADNHHYFIAPANGYVMIQIDRDNSSGYTPYYSINGIQMQYGPFWTVNYIHWNIPLRKNDVLRFWSNLNENKFQYRCKRFTKSTNMSPLYFYVGETLQDAKLINIGRIVENIANIEKLAKIGEELEPMKTRYVVSKWESGNNYCTIYNDGWCEQGGYIYVSGEVDAPVTYHQPYKDDNYVLTLGWNEVGSVSRNNDTSNGYNKTTTGFIAYGKTGTGNMDWRATGYIS